MSECVYCVKVPIYEFHYDYIKKNLCVKSVHVWSYSGPLFSRIFPYSD